MRSSILAFAVMGATIAVVAAVPSTAEAGYYRSGHHRPFRFHRFGFHFGHRYGYHYRPYAYGYGSRAYGYGSRYFSDSGALRIKVKPKNLRKQAQVYVNGALAGAVDDFDGGFQRLRLAPGEYELEVRLDGYRSFHERILVSRGHTYTIRHELEPLSVAEREEMGEDSTEAH